MLSLGVVMQRLQCSQVVCSSLGRKIQGVRNALPPAAAGQKGRQSARESCRSLIADIKQRPRRRSKRSWGRRTACMTARSCRSALPSLPAASPSSRCGFLDLKRCLLHGALILPGLEHAPPQAVLQQYCGGKASMLRWGRQSALQQARPWRTSCEQCCPARTP